jgi:uncharacterized protein YpmB
MLMIYIMKIIFKVLIISVLCLFFKGCKSTANTKEKDKLERKDSTDDVRDDQMEDYEEEMRQQNNQSNR